MEGMPVSGPKLPEIGDEIAGKYRITTVLGQGGMGTVFAAENLLTGKRVAIKWLLPEHAQGPSRERLLREARIACSVEHPNIVDIYDVGEHQGGLFLVMEYLRGQPLSELLAMRGRLDPEELIGLLIPAMRGVHAAHQAGVIHRDLKPENIILSEVDGQIIPKVVDFGVSKTVGASSVPHSSLTRTGALVGTPHYMALEQVDGSNLVDPRTDVYAFGIVMYRALTGHFPFDGSSLGEVILKIGTKDPVPMRNLRPELPAALDAVVLRAMSRPRERRFENLEELAVALEPFAPWVRFRERLERSGRIPTSLGSGEARMVTPQEMSPTMPGPRLFDTPASLGALQPLPLSIHGIGPRDTPAHHLRSRRTRAFWLGAAAALLVVLGGMGWLLARLSEEPVASPAPAVPVAPAAARVSASAIKPAAIAAEPAALVEPPADAPIAPVPVEQPTVEPAPETAPQKAATKATKPLRRHSRRHTESDAPNKLIPGERTKGLSSDEF
jgi:serine/threonine protein kinase